MTETEHQPERTVWVAHPSRLPFLPGILIPVLVALLANHQIQLAANWLVERSFPTIPWTQETAVLFIRLAPWIPCLWSLVSLARMLAVRFTRYELTTQRLKVDEGVLRRTHDEVALHRIRDYNVARPLTGLIFGLGTVRLITRDPTHPIVDIRMVPDANEKREAIRQHALVWKAQMGYREFESGGVTEG